MKIKALTSGFGIGAIILIAAAIIALPVRTTQFFKILEGSTGFYKTTDWTVYLLFAVLAVAILAFISLGFINRKKLDYTLEVKKKARFRHSCRRCRSRSYNRCGYLPECCL